MSNRVTITPTKFVNVRGNGKTFGVRVYDSYAQAYDNTWDSIPDDDMDVLKKVMESADEVIRGMIDYIRENETGVEIDVTWYDWDEIKDLFPQE